MPPTHTNPVQPSEPIISIAIVDFIHRVYAWMAGGLLLTSVVAFLVASTPALIGLIVSNMLVFWAILICELLLVWYLSRSIGTMSSGWAGAMFLLYSALNGVTISLIFLVYEISSIGSVFFVTAGMFAIISLYGYTTKKDLTTIGNLAFMALIGIILASLVNIFVHSDGFSLILSYITVIVFVGLTAYDTQKLKNINAQSVVGSEAEKRRSIIGALTLYLDFVNLFLNLLRIMGRRK